jgi:TRAP-type C4-dicarboxylate transport system permease small subunit
METLRKFFNTCNAIEKYFLIALMAAMVVIIFAQVFTRYALNHALYWSEELGKFIFVWVSWLGVSAGMKNKEHIQVLLFPDALRAKGHLKTEKLIHILIDILWFITSIVVLYYGAQIVASQKALGVFGPSTELPMWIAYLCVPLSAALVCFRLLCGTFINVRELIGMFGGKDTEVLK